MKQTFTRAEVNQILVSVFLFAGANNNQGVGEIKGNNYGEMAETVIKANELTFDSPKSIITAIANFK